MDNFEKQRSGQFNMVVDLKSNLFNLRQGKIKIADQMCFMQMLCAIFSQVIKNSPSKTCKICFVSGLSCEPLI